MLSTRLIAAVSLVAALIVPTTATASPATGGEIRAGQNLRVDGYRCTAGFGMRHISHGDGIVLHGLCGQPGSVVYIDQSTPVGVVARQTFPNPPWAWVELYDGWTAMPYAVPDHPVTDDTQTPIGGGVCRAGGTSGWHCGTVRSVNESIATPLGPIHGLTRTDVCSQPGDEGGPFLTGTSAQGIAIHSTGDCASGGTTYFYPVMSISRDHPALTLITV